jgi:hypothetical protein
VHPYLALLFEKNHFTVKSADALRAKEKFLRASFVPVWLIFLAYQIKNARPSADFHQPWDGRLHQSE